MYARHHKKHGKRRTILQLEDDDDRSTPSPKFGELSAFLVTNSIDVIKNQRNRMIISNSLSTSGMSICLMSWYAGRLARDKSPA